MKGLVRWAGVGLAVLLAVMFGHQAVGSPGKEIVGKWEGTFAMGKNDISVRLELRTDGSKIVGELETPHGPWAVTDAKSAGGKWSVEIHTPDNNIGMMEGVLKGDKFEGNYQFPPSTGGEFKLSRVKSAK
jgi:hypothetical protein